MTRAATVTQGEIARVIRAGRKAGATSVRIEAGAMVVTYGLTGQPEATLSPLERARQERDRRVGQTQRP